MSITFHRNNNLSDNANTNISLSTKKTKEGLKNHEYNRMIFDVTYFCCFLAIIG